MRRGTRLNLSHDRVRAVPFRRVALTGILVVLADTLARTLVAPLQLPVGAIMALVGVPAFLWVLLRPPGVAR